MTTSLEEKKRVRTPPSLVARLLAAVKADLLRPLNRIRTANRFNLRSDSQRREEVNPDEINWYALKAVIDWENASEWRKWELLAKYGRR
jgi:hypothetical protein